MEGSGGFDDPGYGPGTIPPQQPYTGYDPYQYDTSGFQYGLPNYYGDIYQPFPPPQRFNGMAIASISCGGASILMLGFGMMASTCFILLGPLALICALVGVILGIIALNQISKDSSYKGKGLAIAGLITSGLSLVGVFFLIIMGIFLFIFLLSMPVYDMMMFNIIPSVGVII